MLRGGYHLYLKYELGVEKVRQRLRDKKIPSLTEKAIWPSESVRNLLVNPVYVGTYIWNRRTRATYCPIRNGKSVELPLDVTISVAPSADVTVPP